MKKNDNMKKQMKQLTTALVMTVLLSGCQVETAPAQNVGLVLGSHEFFPQIDFTMESVEDKIYDACYTYGDVIAVVSDGDPYVAGTYANEKPDQYYDAEKKKLIAKKNTASIIAEMSAMSAKTPEVDTLSAIALCADALNGGEDPEGEAPDGRTMIIIDSGLCTGDSLVDFSSQNLIDTPPETIVDQLVNYHAVPDLENIDVVWIGLGSTCGDQPDLPESYKYKLEELWNSILTAGGANSVKFDSTPMQYMERPSELPSCTIVPVVADMLDVETYPDEIEIPESVKFDETTSVKFRPDESSFIDEAAAASEMEPIAEYLKANPEEVLYVFGMTATVTGGESGVELAKARAEACKQILVEAGAGEDQLICVGLGQAKNPLRVHDTDENGRQIADLAAKNRAVFFVKHDSDLVEILNECVE